MNRLHAWEEVEGLGPNDKENEDAGADDEADQLQIIGIEHPRSVTGFRFRDAERLPGRLLERRPRRRCVAGAVEDGVLGAHPVHVDAPRPAELPELDVVALGVQPDDDGAEAGQESSQARSAVTTRGGSAGQSIWSAASAVNRRLRRRGREGVIVRRCQPRSSRRARRSVVAALM